MHFCCFSLHHIEEEKRGSSFVDWKRVQLFANRIARAGLCEKEQQKMKTKAGCWIHLFQWHLFKAQCSSTVCWESFRLWTDDAQESYIYYVEQRGGGIEWQSSKAAQLVYSRRRFPFCVFVLFIHQKMRWKDMKWWYDIRFGEDNSASLFSFERDGWVATKLPFFSPPQSTSVQNSCKKFGWWFNH